MIGYDVAPHVTMYHRCAVFAAGSIFLGRDPAYWWAVRDGLGWSIRIAGVHELERSALEARIRRVARLDFDTAEHVRTIQDERGEAVE